MIFLMTVFLLAGCNNAIGESKDETKNETTASETASVQEEEVASSADKNQEQDELNTPVEDTLTDEETIQLIIDSETEALEVFADAFQEDETGLSFNESFEEILNRIEAPLSERLLKNIYDNPGYVYEYSYTFPLADQELPTNYRIVDSNDQRKVYVEVNLYEQPTLFEYTLEKEEDDWLITSLNSLHTLSDAYRLLGYALDASPDELDIVDIENPTFEDYIERVVNGEKYVIETYRNHYRTKFFHVDPFTGTVYKYDVVTESTEEIY
ncbi:hypothetical protein ACFQ2J_13585 [Thalassobacillus hwangdonensis]|uniref:Uncharacterized protein n=2 Tax=Thalassobacillus hwangdonensis TaxID=546108 RepID=A0ABW3L6I7_9BACI